MSILMVIEELMRGCDLLNLARNVKVGEQPCYSVHEMVKFRILREGKMTMSLDCRRADFGFFRDLL